MKKVKWYWAFLYALIYVIILGVVGGLLTNVTTKWYTSLNMPVFMPPGIAFSIVWSILYCLTLIVFYEAIKNYDVRGIILFLILGICNILYSALFFTAQSNIGGLVMTSLNLIVAIILFVCRLKKGSKLIYLFTLALFWYTYATALSIALVVLN